MKIDKIETVVRGDKFVVRPGVCGWDPTLGKLLVVTEIISPKRIMVANVMEEDVKQVYFEEYKDKFGTVVHGEFTDTKLLKKYGKPGDWEHNPHPYTLRRNGWWCLLRTGMWDGKDVYQWNCKYYVDDNNIETVKI